MSNFEATSNIIGLGNSRIAFANNSPRTSTVFEEDILALRKYRSWVLGEADNFQATRGEAEDEAEVLPANSYPINLKVLEDILLKLFIKESLSL